jgi:hypothetical protein
VSPFIARFNAHHAFIPVLSRVQAFLPQLEASNAVLAQRFQENPQSVDIENIQEDEQFYIEMVWIALELNSLY